MKTPFISKAVCDLSCLEEVAMWLQIETNLGQFFIIKKKLLLVLQCCSDFIWVVFLIEQVFDLFAH